MKTYLTFDIGGTDLKYGIIKNDLSFMLKESEPTNTKEGGKSIVRQILNIYDNLKNNYNISGIAISSAGVIHPETTEVLGSTGTIENFVGTNFDKEINRHTKIKVSANNDVNSVAICEFENVKESNSVLTMTIGTGIGGAIIINKELYYGNYFSAGEWGNMYVKGEIFEEVSSMRVLVNKAKAIYPEINNGIDVFNLYDNNDKLIIDLVNNYYDTLAEGISNLIYIFNPEHLIIGGGISNRGNKFLNELDYFVKQKLDKRFYEKTKISIAKHKNDAGMIGAFINFKRIYKL